MFLVQDPLPRLTNPFPSLSHEYSGVGLSIGERLIDEFLITRPLTSHLILIPTTRSSTKSADAIRSLRAHLHRTAETSAPLRNRYSSSPDAAPYDQTAVIDRVHLLSAELDLCDLGSVYRAVDRLVHGTLVDPTGVTAGGAGLEIPRLDAVVLNAGLGGWSGFGWGGLFRQALAQGIVQATTFPAFKTLLPRAVLDSREMLRKAKEAAGLEDGEEEEDDSSGEKKGAGDDDAQEEDPPELAQVFCANLFGHYILAHELMPLLARPAADESGPGSAAIPPGRIVWTSSIDACENHLDLDDFQARATVPPYESSKRITDLIALTAELPSVRPLTRAYFAAPFVKMALAAADADMSASISTSASTSSSSPSSANPTPTSSVASDSTSVGIAAGAAPTTTHRPPRVCLSHPGIVCTPLFPLNWFLYFWYTMAMHLARLLGSPWHVVETYLAACAPAWLALVADDAELRARPPAKWGSACDRAGANVRPKRTEVEGWGWEGRVGETAEEEDDEEEGEGEREFAFLKKTRGRKRGATPLTAERKARFEDDARRCWAELERLRAAWEVALGRRPRPAAVE